MDKLTGKIRITAKDPDGIGDSLESAASEIKKQYPDKDIDECHDMLEGITEKYIEYDEYITVEIDLATGEARVVPVKET